MLQQTIQLTIAASLSLATALYAFINSSITSNYSVVDRAWSLVPIAYGWIFASQSMDVRSVTMAVCMTLWGMRLTFNFYRRGGYNKGEQDYRWPVLQKKIPNRIAWTLFNFMFISLYQNVLLLLITMPVYFSSKQPVAWMWSDSLFYGLLLLFLCGETLADQQQWNFQSKKYQLLKDAALKDLPEPYNVGFVQTGLWSISRHPNFFCEQGIWWCLFGLSIPSCLNDPIDVLYSGLGAFLLTLLFLGSTQFTESITSEKYPLYAVYQQRVNALLPGFPAKPVTVDDKPTVVERK